MTTFQQTPFNSIIFEHIKEDRFLIFKESHLTTQFLFQTFKLLLRTPSVPR